MRLNWTTRIALGAGILAAAGMLAVSARSAESAATVYKQKCAGCHGADGKADTPAGKAMKVPSFAESKGKSDSELADIIEKGKGRMPKYGASMKPDEIKEMVAYIRTLAK